MVLAGLTDDNLHAAIVDAHNRMCAAQRDLWAGVAEHDRRGLWRDRGARDETEYLIATFDILRGTARNWVKAAHALDRDPAIADAFSSGTLSADALNGLIDVMATQHPDTTKPLGPFDPIPPTPDPHPTPPPPDPSPEPDPSPGPDPSPDRSPDPAPDPSPGTDPSTDTPPDPDPSADPEPDPPEEDPLDIAARLTAAQLAAWAHALRRKSLENANAAHRRRRLRTTDLENGARLHLDADLFDDDAALLRAALDEYARTATADPDTGRFAPLHHTFADALVEFAAAYLTGRETTTNRPALFLHADAGTLDGHEGWAQTTAGNALAAETIRRFACYCHVTFIIHDHQGNDLYLGRSQRLPSWALAETIRRRDGGCRFPGCHRTHWTQPHHILEWDADHGPTDHNNLCTLCRQHHRLCHEGGWTITGSPTTTLTFHSPTGLTLTSTPNHTPRPTHPAPDTATPGTAPPTGTNPPADAPSGTAPPAARPPTDAMAPGAPPPTTAPPRARPPSTVSPAARPPTDAPPTDAPPPGARPPTTAPPRARPPGTAPSDTAPPDAEPCRLFADA